MENTIFVCHYFHNVKINVTFLTPISPMKEPIFVKCCNVFWTSISGLNLISYVFANQIELFKKIKFAFLIEKMLKIEKVTKSQSEGLN